MSNYLSKFNGRKFKISEQVTFKLTWFDEYVGEYLTAYDGFNIAKDYADDGFSTVRSNVELCSIARSHYINKLMELWYSKE